MPWVGGALLALACACVALARVAGWARLSRTLAGMALVVIAGSAGFELVTSWLDPLPESGVRVVDRLTGINMPDEQLGWSGRPKISLPQKYAITRGGRREGEVEITLTNNSHGFRDLEQQRDPARPAIVVVGDSLAWGHAVEREQSAVHLLRERLPAAQVFNLACQAYSIDQFERTYAVRGRELRPSVVVCMFLVIPKYLNSSPLGWGLRKPWYRANGDALELMGVPVRWPEDRAEHARLVREAEASAVCDLASAWHFLARSWLQDRSWIARRGVETFDRSRFGDPMPPPDPIVLRILRELQSLVERDGGKLVMALAPERSVLDRKTPPPEQVFAREVDAFAGAGLDVLDFTRCFMPEGAQLYDRDRHPGIEGNVRMADALANKLRPLLPR